MKASEPIWRHRNAAGYRFSLPSDFTFRPPNSTDKLIVDIVVGEVAELISDSPGTATAADARGSFTEKMLDEEIARGIPNRATPNVAIVSKRALDLYKAAAAPAGTAATKPAAGEAPAKRTKLNLDVCGKCGKHMRNPLMHALRLDHLGGRKPRRKSP